MATKKTQRKVASSGNLVPRKYLASEVYLIGVDMGVGIGLAVLDRLADMERTFALGTKDFMYEYALRRLRAARREIAEFGR